MIAAGHYALPVHLAMAGWYPLCFAAFLALPAPRAVASLLVTGFLLLPNVVYDLPGIPNYDKSLAIVLGIFVSAALVDLGRLAAFRPRWIDLPIAVLCAAPLVSSLVNGDGLYLGLSNAFNYLVRWALPWVLGRVYFVDFESQKFLAVAVVVGALIYVPFALYEVKMSPLLHKQVYGVALKAFRHARRGHGLWRPNVFVVHGLAYALFNALAALLAFWLWLTGTRRTLVGLPMGLVVVLLFTMTLAAQSSTAILLLLVGMTCLLYAMFRRKAWPLALMVLVPPAYVSLRQGLRWDGTEMIAVAQTVFGDQRAQSLGVRLGAESLLRDRILERPITGYNDFRRFTGNTYDDESPVLVDSTWLLLLGLYGAVALAGLWTAQLVAPVLLLWKVPPRFWSNPALAVTAALGVASALVVLDGLLNAFEIQAFTAGAAGVAGLLGTTEGRRLWLAE